MFTGVGEAKAAVSGAEGANVLAKTGEAANAVSKTTEATEAANAAEKTAEAANAAKKAGETRELGEMVSSKAEDVFKKKWDEVFDQKNVDEAYEKYKQGKLAKKQVPRSKEAWLEGNKGRGGCKNVLKGQMGEYQADQYMAGKGYTKLNHEGKLIDPLNPSKGKGLDGVWHDPGPPPKYIISETKFGGSKLTGDQMSDQWIRKNLESSIDDNAQYRAISKELDKGTIEKQLLNVDENGNVITTILKIK